MPTLPAADTSRTRPVARRLAAGCAVAAGMTLLGCGQTGPLYLPDEGVTSPVIIRPAPAAAPAPAEADPGLGDEDQAASDRADPAVPEPTR